MWESAVGADPAFSWFQAHREYWGTSYCGEGIEMLLSRTWLTFKLEKHKSTSTKEKCHKNKFTALCLLSSEIKFIYLNLFYYRYFLHKYIYLRLFMSIYVLQYLLRFTIAIHQTFPISFESEVFGAAIKWLCYCNHNSLFFLEWLTIKLYNDLQKSEISQIHKWKLKLWTIPQKE